jgi:hypothetical protein
MIGPTTSTLPTPFTKSTKCWIRKARWSYVTIWSSGLEGIGNFGPMSVEATGFRFTLN